MNHFTPQERKKYENIMKQKKYLIKIYIHARIHTHVCMYRYVCLKSFVWKNVHLEKVL